MCEYDYVTVSMTVFGNKVFVDVGKDLKVRLSGFRVGPRFSEQCSYERNKEEI